MSQWHPDIPKPVAGTSLRDTMPVKDFSTAAVASALASQPLCRRSKRSASEFKSIPMEAVSEGQSDVAEALDGLYDALDALVRVLRSNEVLSPTEEAVDALSLGDDSDVDQSE